MYKAFLIIILFVPVSFFAACDTEGIYTYYVPEETITEAYDQQVGKHLIDTLYTNSVLCQSAACYNDYLFLIKDKLASITLYSMTEKKKIRTLNLPSHSEQNNYKMLIYHCNQASFGKERFDSNDYFPTLYVSQRNNNEGRCFVNVLRIIPTFNEHGIINNFSTEEIQTIFLPKMDDSNAMGNANVVIDENMGKMIVYSRNNNPLAKNYLTCRISFFPLPELKNKDVFYENADIESSFELPCSAYNMQGACLYNNYLYIGQGYKSAGYIKINKVSLLDRKLESVYDLLSDGFTLEPEGFFVYNDTPMFTASNFIFSLNDCN